VKKNILGLACIFVYLIAVMSCEIPHSITIKGKPGVHIPLGSPFSSLEEGERLEDYISSAKIREMMGNTGSNGIQLYDYTGDNNYSNVQTYLLHYPLARIELSFANNVPALPPGLIPQDLFYSLEGEYQIMHGLRNFLGSDVAFSKALGYIYAADIGENSKMSLTFSNNEDIDIKLIDDDTSLISLPREEYPEFPESEDGLYAKLLPQHSLKNNNYVDLSKILNASSNSTLKYQIKIPLTEINEINRDKIVCVDLVIVLPLEFIISTPSSDPDFVKLDMGGIFDQLENDNDLFGRTDDNDNDLFNNIESVTITLKNTKNTVIDSIYILVITGDKNQILEFKSNQSVRFDKNDLSYPFSPQFETLLKKENNADHGIFRIKRLDPDNPPVFDFFITVEAQANINYTMKF